MSSNMSSNKFDPHKVVVDLQRFLIDVAQDIESNATSANADDKVNLLKTASICRKAKQDLDCVNLQKGD